MVISLPIQPTPFIGRSDELREITLRLADPTCRLLTLVGPGGIGKTRLALAVADKLQSDFPDGVFFVPLQAISTPEYMVAAIAETMNIQFYSYGERENQLFQSVQDKTLLLVLDNFEHLLEGTGLVTRLLASAPSLKIIVTSRERLNLQEEWLYEVFGLLYPKNGETDVDSFSAVQLFVQSARRVNPSFSFETARLAILDICRLVEGMPLAIELVSSWGRVLDYRELAQEITRGLDILETQVRNMPARHRSMRAVLDSSWGALTAEEGETIAWLAVFHGGFTREAAEAVACPHPRILAALVDKSWLRYEVDTRRYNIHELVRQYAQERLTQLGETEAYLAHATYFADFLCKRQQDIKCCRQLEALNEIDTDFENILAAWQWVLREQNFSLLNQMIEGLNFYLDMRARFAEGETMFRAASEMLADSALPEQRMIYFALRTRRFRMIMLGSLTEFGTYDIFQQELTAALTELRQYADSSTLAYQLLILGSTYHRTPLGKLYLEEALERYTQLNDRFYMAETLVWLSFCIVESAPSQALLKRAESLQREIGDLNGLSWCLQHFARIAFSEHRYADYERHVHEAIMIQQQRHDLKGLFHSKIESSLYKLWQGDFASARAIAEESLRLALMLNILPIKQAALVALGMLDMVTEHDLTAGARLCQEALDIAVPYAFMVMDVEPQALTGLSLAAYHRQDLNAIKTYYQRLRTSLFEGGQAQYTHFTYLAPLAILIWAKDGQVSRAVELLSLIHSLPDAPETPILQWLDQVPLYSRLQEELRQTLGDQAFDAAWTRGQALSWATYLPQLYNPVLPATTLPRSPNQLTEREIEILRLAADGLSNNGIAEQLVLSAGTVKWYLSEIYSKLGVANRAQAIAHAHELGLLT